MRPHSEECRARLMAAMRDDPQGQRFLEEGAARLAGRSDARPHQQEEGEATAAERPSHGQGTRRAMEGDDHPAVERAMELHPWKRRRMEEVVKAFVQAADLMQTTMSDAVREFTNTVGPMQD